MQRTQAQKAADFVALHEGETFIIPNPWDAGSARVLEGLGFEALATTSSGFAFTLGRADGETTAAEVMAHVQALDQAMAEDERVVVLGEDVDRSTIGATKGLIEKYGTNRVRNTPISEATFVGACVGAAAAPQEELPH